MTAGTSLHIGGHWIPAASGATFGATSPADGRHLGDLALADRFDTQRAIAAARAAAATWGRTSAFERAALLARIADRVASRREELALALSEDQGKPLRAEAYDEVDELLAYWHMAAADATRLDGLMPPSVDAHKRVLVQRVPRGVVGVITPWNWPYTMAAELIAPALASGDTVVWNPARHTSLCSLRLAECIVAADLPPGVFNLVTGPGATVGDEIAANPATAAVGFVGSTATGLEIARRAAGKELLLEMGGNGPLVVMDDADVAAAVTATVAACFLNAGQSCTAGERILVHEAIHERYVAALLEAVASGVRLGDPLAEATTMGPLNNEATATKTGRHVADALAGGGRLLAGGQREPGLGSPLYFAPTVVDGVTEAMAVAREETFGPVVPITAIANEAEAVGIVNTSPYGLLSAIFTQDLRRGLRFAEAVHSGWVNINEGTNYWESHLPFGGGAGTISGLGRVGGRFPIERLTELKTIVINLA
jgi:acyl-CoA reductase-like NAD-dependent aldehyde dehydrogenase